MKTLKFIFVAGLALASSLAARAEISAQGWLETYYLNPQPAELGRQVHRLSTAGYFEQSNHVAIAIGFLSTVFAQNPDRVDGWLVEFTDLPQRDHRLIAAALWQAGDAKGAELLRQLGSSAAVLRLAGTTSDNVADTPVRSPSSMNLQWGAFLATGDERYIVNVLAAMGTGLPALDSAARYALAENAAAHPRVLEICRAQLNRQPEEVRGLLRAALDDAEAAKPRA
jgi:hypothetical protein